jgi:hypothetical protein
MAARCRTPCGVGRICAGRADAEHRSFLLRTGNQRQREDRWENVARGNAKVKKIAKKMQPRFGHPAEDPFRRRHDAAERV